MFENLIVFSDDILFDAVRKDHYLSMPKCERTWNEYFWHIRYKTTLPLGAVSDIASHEQAIFKTLEKLYSCCASVDDSLVEPFVDFAESYDSKQYIYFDYFHPAITETGVSLDSPELREIVELLKIDNFSFEEIAKLIEKNIDDPKGELLVFSSRADEGVSLKVDTYTAGMDQIHPVDMLIRCPKNLKQQVDALLVQWWEKFWDRLGPYVAVSPIDKFDAYTRYANRKRIKK